MKLSIIIPVFNEEKTILEILKRVEETKIPGFDKEMLVVNDGSTDTTASKIKKSRFLKKITFIDQNKNQGKGTAVKAGIEKASGDYVVIQDADLEYNPKDIVKLTSQIKENAKQAIYGTRLNRLPNLSRDERTLQFLIHYLGNRFLSLVTSILYGQWITDMETCYKLFPKIALNNIKLNAKGFEFEPEITLKLLKSGYKILEVPITTNPRGYEEGKKLNTVRDGFKALWTLIRYRI